MSGCCICLAKNSGNLRTVSLWALALLAVITGLVSTGTALAQNPLYVKQGSLQQTLLSTRARLRTWQVEQQEALALVKIGAWHATSLQSGESAAQVAVMAMSLGENRPGSQTPERWTECQADSNGNPILAGVAADYVATTITAQRPVRLTLELSRHEPYGGFAYRPPQSNAGVTVDDPLVWLNGQQLPLHNKLQDYPVVSVAKRRGWHDAVLIDVNLAGGANQLLLSLGKGDRKSWFTTVGFAPNPIAALWALVENDFPRSANRLLETIPASWFSPANGWFSDSVSVHFEQQLLEQLEAELGAAAQWITTRAAELGTANESASNSPWLDLCVTAAQLKATLQEINSLQAAVSRLDAAYAPTYPGSKVLASIADLRQRAMTLGAARFDPTDQLSKQLLDELESLKYRALVARNPLLSDSQLVFIKRYTYDSDHYYDEFVAGIRRFGGNLCVLSLADGTVREIAPELGSGLFDRYDLSFDAQRIAFGYKPPRPEGFRIYEIGVDGTNLRQITTPPDDEEQRITTYATCSREQLSASPGRYGHWTDDMHPCYLPDGGIVFTSTRSQRSVLCGGHGLTVTNLYRANADGSDLQQLSQGALSEFCPSVMNDGRILYNRWEYVDKGAGAVQSLWAMCPDGSRSEEVYGNNITTPGVFNQAHNVPGHNNLIVCLGTGHCPGNIGAIVLIDLMKNKRTVEAMTALTPNCIPEGNWGMRQFRNGEWITDIHGPLYCDPYPLCDQQREAINGTFFLVSCNPTGEWNDPVGYGLYLLDVFGNRVPIYRDPNISCWQARPLRPRPAPPILADVPNNTAMADAASATIVVSDVYEGLTGVPRGTVKYLRVMEQVPRPWSVYLDYQPNDSSPGQMVAISLYTHLSVKVLHGVVPVHEDGSAYFTVPADRDIFLQALDEDFLEIQRMRTFVNFQPGEQRSCIGCHEPRNQAPVNRPLLALQSPPAAPAAQPGEVAPRPLHYPTDVQPILDRHCVSCHSPEKLEGDIDLTGTMTELFCRSYENIIDRDLVGYIQEFIGPKPEGANAMGYAPSVPPYTYGSHQSKLIGLIRQGHYDAQLTREELITLATWVDANAPYYGSYFGRRNIAFQSAPEFRPTPTLDSALGIRHNE